MIKKGSTPVLTDIQVRQLFAAINTDTLVGLHDRALIGMMLYMFGRASAVVTMQFDDYFPGDKRWFIRLHEKGGKRHEMPVYSVLEQYLDAYPKEGGIAEAKKTPLFRSANRRTDTLTENRLQARNVLDMVRRRVRDGGIATPICCHSFRATGITNYLRNGGTVEKAQRMAAHESARTTGLYDRRTDELAVQEIEKVRFDMVESK